MWVKGSRRGLPPDARGFRAAWRRQLSAVVALTAVMALAAGQILVVSAVHANEYIEDTDRFPGWKGELPQQQPLADDPATIGFGESGKVPCQFGDCCTAQTEIQIM
jgi:hypothetical protein